MSAPDPVDDAALRSLHAVAPTSLVGRPSIDDATWRDLDLPQLLDRIAQACSPLGQLRLYGWLRAPAITEDDVPALEARHHLTRALTAPTRDRLRPLLASLPRLPSLLLESLAGAARLPSLGRTPAILATAAVLSSLLFHVSVQLGVLGVAAMFIVNLLYRMRVSATLESASASLRFLGAALHTAARAAQLPGDSWSAPRQRILTLLGRLRPVARAVRELSFPALLDDFPGEYIRLFLLNDERRVSRSAALVAAHREPLTELLALLGELEAACATAAWVEAQQLRPVERGGDSFLAIALRHPLLPTDSVANDLELSGGLVITGSNMSGKSTFLRAVALNALLAQSVGWAAAERYRAPLVRVATSLRNDDQLLSGESYYFAEALRLRTLLELASAHPLLVAIDEPFRGTNTCERVAGSAAVVRGLRRAGAFVLVATHDRELGRLLTPALEEVHFADQWSEQGLRFDYRLRKGPATSRNAIRLMASLGYAAAVVEEANALAEVLDPAGALTPAPAAAARSAAARSPAG